MAELLQTESAERSTALVGTPMQNIAVNNRSYLDLVKLVPGVVPEIFIWRSRPDGTRYSRSKVEYAFIFVFITSPPAILRAHFWRAAWEFQNGHSGDCGYGVYQVSPSTANPFPSRARERVQMGYWRRVPPEVRRYRGATLLQVPHAPKQRSGER